MPNSALRLLLVLACGLTAALPAAAAAEYQVMVVACTQQDCQRVAEPRMNAQAGDRSSFTRDDLKLEVETLSARRDAVEANIKVEVNAAPGRTQFSLPCRVTSRTLTSLATFVSAGTIYHIWARLKPDLADLAALR